MTSRFVGLPCCLTIICDNAFLPTLLSTNVKHPKFGCHVTSLCQGLRRSAGSGGDSGEDPKNQVDRQIQLSVFFTRGPCSRAIQGLAITNENYKSAEDILNERFRKTRQVTQPTWTNG